VLVEHLSGRARLLLAAISAAAILGWGAMMHRYTNASYPWWDASAAILSVVAQILLARRYIENWVLWIVVDLLSIGLYAAKGLWVTMVLYAIFLVLAALGLLRWRRVHRDAGPVVA
jgi:nicotinamide mononucleotide transporter